MRPDEPGDRPSPVPSDRAASASRVRRFAVGAATLAVALGGGFVPPSVRAQAPGAELFAKPPQTPLEYWDAVDYLVRTGQPGQAAPYLQAFLQANPDDATLLQIRDRYGVGSVLNLADYPETRPQAESLLNRFNEAARRQARDPERLRRFVAALTGSQTEQRYALENLRPAGPYAVPYIVETLSEPGLSGRDRGRLVVNLARLGPPALPAIVAMLDAPDATLAADAADALGRLGDPRAIPFLTFSAVRQPESVLTEPARQAIAQLTGRSWGSQIRSPLRLLIGEAERYLTHTGSLGADPAEVWVWQDGNVAPRPATTGQIEGYYGLKLARQALTLVPTDRQAQGLVAALALQKSVESVGIAAFPQQDPLGAYALAVAAGPEVMANVLRLALDRNLPDVAAAAATVLGNVADRDVLYIPTSPPHPLVAALDASDRRTRFAAAQALVNLEPPRPFPGSSRVVPVLAQFAAVRTAPRVVVVDGSPTRANTVASTLSQLGFDPLVASSGKEGFRLAASSADVEAVLIEPTALVEPWTARDLIVNLRADSRTRELPVLIHAQLDLQNRLRTIVQDNPKVAFIVTPVSARASAPSLQRELARLGARPLSAAERAAYAQQATGLLATLANRPGNPFEADLPSYEPTLTAGLSNPPIAPAAVAGLAQLPVADAQRSLADTVLETSRPEPLRLQAAVALVRSLQRFGTLLTDAQQQRLTQALDEAASPQLRNVLSTVLGALRPRAEVVGPRLQALDPAAVLAPAPDAAAEPAPVPPPSPSPVSDPMGAAREAGEAPARLLSHRRFRIPFEVAPADRSRVAELRLVVSGDLGRTWRPAGTARPDESAFPTFTAPWDGEFWFAVRTLDQAGRLFPADESALQPCMKVVVAADPTAAAPVEPRR